MIRANMTANPLAAFETDTTAVWCISFGSSFARFLMHCTMYDLGTWGVTIRTQGDITDVQPGVQVQPIRTGPAHA